MAKVVFENEVENIQGRDPAMQRRCEVGHPVPVLNPHPTTMKRRAAAAQAMVEFALALPIFLLVVYGLLEVGRLVFMYAAVASASREGARYASAWGVNSNGTQQDIDCDGIRNAAMNVGFLLGLQKSSIIIAYDTGPGTASTLYCPSNKAVDTTVDLSQGQRVRVTVNATYQPVLPFFLPLTTQNISSTTARTLMGVIDLAQ